MVTGAPAELGALCSKIAQLRPGAIFVQSRRQACSSSSFPSSLLALFLLHRDLIPGNLLPGSRRPVPVWSPRSSGRRGPGSIRVTREDRSTIGTTQTPLDCPEFQVSRAWSRATPGEHYCSDVFGREQQKPQRKTPSGEFFDIGLSDLKPKGRSGRDELVARKVWVASLLPLFSPARSLLICRPSWPLAAPDSHQSGRRASPARAIEKLSWE